MKFERNRFKEDAKTVDRAEDDERSQEAGEDDNSGTG